jgi:hypothetical protein
MVKDIDLDYDLSTGKTGYDVACWIEDAVSRKIILPMRMCCHSLDSAGVKRVDLVIESMKRLGERNE